MMKKILATESVAVLFLFALAMFVVAFSVPRTTHAAFDDANLAVDTVLSVGGVTLTVSGATSTIATITVEANKFYFTLNSGSSLEVTSAAGKVLETDGQGYIATNTCTSGVSVLGFTANSTATTTLFPTSSSCSGAATTGTAAAAATGSGSGNGAPVSSGGGGGGGAATAPVIVGGATPSSNATVIAQLQAQVQALVAQLNILLAARGLPPVGGSFTRDLEVGSTGDDVKALQAYLNTRGYVIASSGPGSSGNETTKFGGLTRAALVKLQKAAGITPAAGYFGPKTRAYVAANP